MNKILVCLCALSIFASHKYDGGTTAPVILAGSVVKHMGTEIQKKYPRKNCPVCKGNGWYISGDKITKVPCGYCEPETETNGIDQSNQHKKGLIRSVK